MVAATLVGRQSSERRRGRLVPWCARAKSKWWRECRQLRRRWLPLSPASKVEQVRDPGRGVRWRRGQSVCGWEEETHARRED